MPRPRKPTGVVLTEPHSPASLKYVLDKYLPSTTAADEEWRNREDMKRIVRKLYDRSKRGAGIVPVSYHQKIYGGKADGRMYDDDAGLQMMWVPIRAALVRDMMRRDNEVIADLDIEKCHPNLFVQECDRLSVSADLSFLSGFATNPDSLYRIAARDAGANKDQAKQLVCSVLNLGGIDGWLNDPKNNLVCDPVSPLYREVKAAQAQIKQAVTGCMHADPPLVERARQSLLDEGAEVTEWELAVRFQHLLLSRAENACLQAAWHYLKRTSHKVMAFVFDGLVVTLRLTDGGKAGGLPATQIAAMIERICDNMARAVRADTPYRVTFKHKDWDTSITIPDDPNDETLDDVTATKRFVAWLAKEGHRLLRCDDTLYLYQPEVGVYKDVSKSAAGLRGLMSQCADIEGYGRSVILMNKIIVLLPTFCDEQPEFILRADATGRLAFDNGVYDFATGELLPFSPDIVLFDKLPHQFPLTAEEVAEVEAVGAEVRLRVIDAIWGDDAEFIMQVTSRGMAGQVEDKRFMMCIGDGNAGKGVWMAQCKSSFGKYVGSINSGNLVSTPRSDEGDQAKAQSWMLAVHQCRLVFGSEFKLGGAKCKREIDGNIVKMLSTGGEPQTARQNNENEREFMMHGLVTIFANDLPRVSNVNSCEATRERLTYFKMPFRYLNGEHYEANKNYKDVRKGDPSIKAWVTQPEVGRAFAYLVCKSYVAEKPDMPTSVAQYTDEWCRGDGAAVNVLLDVLQPAEDGSVTTADVQAAVEQRGVNMSATKLGHEIKKLFGIVSTTIRLPGQGKTTRVYEGLRLL